MIFKVARLALVCMMSKLGMISVLAKDGHFGYENDTAKVTANLRVGYDTNLYDSAVVKKSSAYYQSGFAFLADANKATYGIQSRYSYDLYAPDTKKDIAHSHALNISSYWSPFSSNTLFLSTDMKKIDERRGTGLTADSLNFDNKLDSYRYNSIQSGYSFERLNQKSIVFSLRYGVNRKEYSSNSNLALSANLEQKSTVMNLGYKWANNKKIYISSSKTKEQYPDVINKSKNSENEISSIGIIWPLSSITNISVNVGKENKSFDSRSESLKTNYWSSRLNWSPLSYTNISLESTRKQEPISKINQTLDENSTIGLRLKYIRSKQSEIDFQVKEERNNETINSIKRTDKKTLYSLSSSYRDFILTLIFERNKKSQSSSTSKLSIYLDYSFGGAI